MKLKLGLTIKLATIVCGGLGACHPVVAGDKPNIEPQARSLVEHLAARYRTVRSYADVTVMSYTGANLFPADRSDEFRFRAQIAWQKPNRAQIVKYAANGVARATSDGTTLRAYTPRQAGYYLQRPANWNSIIDAMNEIGIGGPGLGFITRGDGMAALQHDGLKSLKMGSDTLIAGVRAHQVIAYLEFPSGETATETLSIGAQDGLLRRVTQEYASAKGHTTFVETHSDIKLDPALPTDSFAFIVPPHAKPIDYYARLEPDRSKPNVKVGALLPSFQELDLKGNLVALDDYRGKPVIIHFFATWEATAADVPAMVRLADKYKAAGLVVLGVALDAKREPVTALATKAHVSYSIIFDGSGWHNSIAKLYGVRSLPTTLLIGRDGKLRLVGGRPAAPDFEAAITAALDSEKNS